LEERQLILVEMNRSKESLYAELADNELRLFILYSNFWSLNSNMANPLSWSFSSILFFWKGKATSLF
jgi:hypothetical protein